MKFLIPNAGKSVHLFCKYCCPTILLVLICLIAPVSASESPKLQPEDCGKCHAFQIKMIAASGGKHATEVGCLDCHPQHPPKSENAVSACVLCHEDRPHYQIGDCLHCHGDPHKPLESLKYPIKPARKECISCHAEVGTQMKESTSRHGALYCTRCHTSHGDIPECLDCHEPHVANQVEADCKHCHPAHKPLQIAPVGYTPTGFCRPCHITEANDINRTKTYHGSLNCSFCHKGSHPSTPDCKDCHGLPHATAIHRRQKNCLDCHGDAHRLISNK